MLKFKSLVAAVGLTAIAATTWAADITGAGATFPFLSTPSGLKATKPLRAPA